MGPESVRAVLLSLGGQHGYCLHGLAESHVVGEDRADSEVAEQPEPTVTALLEREEGMRHRPRCAEGLVAPVVVAGEQRAKGVVELDLAELEPCILDFDSRDGADEVDDRSLATAVEEQERPLDLGAPQSVPAATNTDQRLLGGSEFGELFLGEGRVADRELPVESGESVGREQTAGSAGGGGSGEVEAKPARRADPAPGQQDGHAELLQARDRIAEHESDAVVVELERGRLHRVEREAALGEDGLDQPELAVYRDSRVGRAKELEHRVPTVVKQGCGQRQSRIVGRLEPQLEHNAGRAVGLGPGLLVEPEAEQPGRDGAPLETAIDPVRDPPLEGAEA